MTVTITELNGEPATPRRTTLATSTAYPTAATALTTLVPLPPGWTTQVHNASFATYHGPANTKENRELICAQQPAERILFTA